MGWLLVTGLGFVLGTLLAAEETKRFSFVDLQPKANKLLKEKLGNIDGNNLASLPKGDQLLEGVRFQIGDGLVQLGSKELEKPEPDRVEGILVGQTLAKLHFLHSTAFGAADAGDVANGTKIAKYEVHYEGGATETISVVYGEDVRDFWDDENVTRAQVAWKGENEATKEYEAQLILYLCTWENPLPTKKVVSIDYVKVGDTSAAPFCVAISLEEK
jgi:hypothetical protein